MWWESSVNQGEVKLRIKSFLLLVFPMITTILSHFNIEIGTGEDFTEIASRILDGVFIIGFGISQLYAWVRSTRGLKTVLED